MSLNNNPSTVLGPTNPATFPAEAAPWAWVLTDNAAYDGNILRPLRYMDEAYLRNMAANIALMDIILPFTLEAWDLPQLDEPGFWVGKVLPELRKELDRRARPSKTWDSNRPIARLKALDIEDVACKFTDLQGSGNRLKGRCPLHEERTPSFYVYTDSQRWRCFGACAEGGDVVDLLRRLGDQGKHIA